MQQGATCSSAYVISQRLWGVREGTEAGSEVAAGRVDLDIESEVNVVDMVVIMSAGALSMVGVGESGVVSNLGLGQGLEKNS